MACSKELRQQILRNTVPQTLADILDFARELRATAEAKVTSYEADEMDYHQHKAVCHHCTVLETAVANCNEKA